MFLQKLVEISVQLKTIQNETQNIQFAKIVITPIVHIDSEFSGIFSLCRHLYLIEPESERERKQKTTNKQQKPFEIKAF